MKSLGWCSSHPCPGPGSLWREQQCLSVRYLTCQKGSRTTAVLSPISTVHMSITQTLLWTFSLFLWKHQTKQDIQVQSFSPYLFKCILWVIRKNHYYLSIGIFSQDSLLFPTLNKTNTYLNHIQDILLQAEAANYCSRHWIYADFTQFSSCFAREGNFS